MKLSLLPPRLIYPAAIISIFLFSCRESVPERKNDENPVMAENEIKLPLPIEKGTLSLEEIIVTRRSERTFRGNPLNLNEVGQMLWSAQGITLQSRGYKAVPSAGATFPLEIYVVAGRVNRLQPGLYKYIPQTHSLVKTIDGDLRQSLSDVALSQHMIIHAPASFVITADYERTARRYGERATRYVHMEVGHAGQNLNLQAISLGYGAVMVGAFQDENVKKVLGLPENEQPLYIIPVGKPQ
jgi:SagB-type dehydrogenase family enzyme